MSIEKSLKEIDLDLNVVLIAVLIVFVPTFIGITYTIFGKLGIVFPIALLALLAGLLFESFRIVGNWKIVILKFAISYMLSLILLIHPEYWTYFFMFIYSLFVIVFNNEKVVPKLTEGITLLQSLSMIYWLADKGLFRIQAALTCIILSIFLLFALFSIVHALFYFPLNKSARLTLSIWSSVIMLIIAIDNIYQVHHQDTVEHLHNWSQGLFIVLQYFLLGVSAIYMMQNFILLYIFLPDKHEQNKTTWRKAKIQHLRRYSDQQVKGSHAFFCMIYAVLLYGLNYIYGFLPPLTMIWLVFFTVAMFMQLFTKRAENIELKTQS